MSAILLKGVKALDVNNTTAKLEEGFAMASFYNSGDVDATLIQDGETWPIPAGLTYELPLVPGYFAYYAVSIVATGTRVYCTYLK
jgi:hypothetical protein